MSERSWWRSALEAVSREYERRIRRASEVSEYGAHHDHSHPSGDDEAAAEIVNLPRGTPVRRPPPSPLPEASGSPEPPAERRA